ncbi:MAG TPA: hypothetical protein VNN79_18910 [Actinomycetota bacterium]|nr:hypothetical protein [Actinomycetota bacterium]
MADHPNRKWKRAHKNSGYHLQEWNWKALSHDHPICGVYICADGSVLAIRFLEDGHTGPELELRWDDGHAVTVLDDTVAQGYIDMLGAQRV